MAAGADVHLVQTSQQICRKNPRASAYGACRRFAHPLLLALGKKSEQRVKLARKPSGLPPPEGAASSSSSSYSTSHSSHSQPQRINRHMGCVHLNRQMKRQQALLHLSHLRVMNTACPLTLAIRMPSAVGGRCCQLPAIGYQP